MAAEFAGLEAAGLAKRTGEFRPDRKGPPLPVHVLTDAGERLARELAARKGST